MPTQALADDSADVSSTPAEQTVVESESVDEAADGAEDEVADLAETAVDGAASDEQSADEAAGDDVDAAVADDAADEAVADEVATTSDEAVEEEEAAPEEAAPAEAPMVLMAKSSVAAAKGHWEVTASRGHGLQRYWIEADGSVAKNRLIDPAEGSGWWAYARPEGYVVRGKYAAKDGKVYLANNDGRLENPGWVVTNKYDGGMQRYWIDAEAHAAVPGYSRDGWVHYTLPNKGYVARGAFTDSNGRKMSADNDGRVKGGVPRAYNGWVVANLGAGLQRYWFRNDVMAKGELLDASETGWWAYARPEGYVVRGKYAAKDGKVYLANNDGKLENPGWLVTNKYDGGYQRYWIDSSAHAAVPGYSAEGWHHYTLPTKGYVLRGKYAAQNGYVYLANNDGKLENPGWLVTNKYGDGIQRYWVDAEAHACVPGYSEDGWAHYTLSGKGYVMRNKYEYINANGTNTWFVANNDGRLTRTEIFGATIIEKYLAWAVQIANDNTHGYDQDSRQGPNYDCSSLVINSLKMAGLKTGTAYYTGDMRSQLTKYGFTWIPDVSQRRRGDILLKEYVHTEFYLGNDTCVGARMNEFGGIVGGRSGDQTGKEISIDTFATASRYGWDGILRLTRIV